MTPIISAASGTPSQRAVLRKMLSERSMVPRGPDVEGIEARQACASGRAASSRASRSISPHAARDDRQRDRQALAPERPVVPAPVLAINVRNAERGQISIERAIVEKCEIEKAAVEVDDEPAQARRHPIHITHRTVGREQARSPRLGPEHARHSWLALPFVLAAVPHTRAEAVGMFEGEIDR